MTKNIHLTACNIQINCYHLFKKSVLYKHDMNIEDYIMENITVVTRIFQFSFIDIVSYFLYDKILFRYFKNSKFLTFENISQDLHISY